MCAWCRGGILQGELQLLLLRNDIPELSSRAGLCRYLPLSRRRVLRVGSHSFPRDQLELQERWQSDQGSLPACLGSPALAWCGWRGKGLLGNLGGSEAAVSCLYFGFNQALEPSCLLGMNQPQHLLWAVTSKAVCGWGMREWWMAREEAEQRQGGLSCHASHLQSV